MSLLNKFKEYKSKKLLKEAKNEYHSAETKEKAIDRASEVAFRAIIAHPETEKIGAMNVLENLQKSELSREVKLNTFINLVTTDEIENLDQFMIEAVEKLNFNQEEIKKILRETSEYISMDTAKQIANQISNVKIKQEEISRLEKIEKLRKEWEKKTKEEKKTYEENKKKEFLKQSYKQTDRVNMENLVSEMVIIMNSSRLPEIQQMVRRVLARAAAIDCKRLGNTKISTLTRVIPAEEMIQRIPIKLAKSEQENDEQTQKEMNFIELIELEYNNIKDLKEYKGGYDFDKKTLEQMVLSQIARNVVNTFNEVGIIDIPQSKEMREMSEEQEEFFIQQIRIYGKNITDIEKIKNQIRGHQDYEEDDWLKVIRKIPDNEKEEYLKGLTRQVKNGRKKIKVHMDNDIEESIDEIRDGLSNISKEDALNILDSIKEEINAIQIEKKESSRERL